MSTILVTVKFPPQVAAFIEETATRVGLAESDISRILLEYELCRYGQAPSPWRPRAVKQAAQRRMVEVAERPPKPVAEPPWAAHVRRFLAERTVEDAESLIWNQDFYAAYLAWAKANDLPPLSHRKVTQAAERAGLTHSNASGRPWIGLRLRDDVAPHTG